MIYLDSGIHNAYEFSNLSSYLVKAYALVSHKSLPTDKYSLAWKIEEKLYIKFVRNNLKIIMHNGLMEIFTIVTFDFWIPCYNNVIFIILHYNLGIKCRQ